VLADLGPRLVGTAKTSPGGSRALGHPKGYDFGSVEDIFVGVEYRLRGIERLMQIADDHYRAEGRRGCNNVSPKTVDGALLSAGWLWRCGSACEILGTDPRTMALGLEQRDDSSRRACHAPAGLDRGSRGSPRLLWVRLLRRWSVLDDITFREFEESDWPAVEEMLAANDEDASHARDVLATPAARAWVAEADEALVGWILTRPILTEDGYDLGGIEDVVVEDAYRGQGIGRRLIVLAEEHWRAAGKAAIQLTVRADNAAALSLYRSLGYSIKEARLRMRKSLGPDPRTMQ
jgi:ribosomal protein S18 acetylase RimI-like enzyme